MQKIFPEDFIVQIVMNRRKDGQNDVVRKELSISIHIVKMIH